MYFPYLRGRQFELIALRELLEGGALSNKIIPIIEPVKLSSTLVKTIETYEKNGRTLSLINNPQVGDFRTEMADDKNEKLKDSFQNIIRSSQSLLFSKILVPNGTVDKFIGKYNGRMMTICTNKDAIPVYTNYFENLDVNYNLILDDGGFRRKIRKNRVLLDDKFNKLDRNSDYIDIDDEPFSEDHLYYAEDGYVGFADYSVVGKDYNDTGFAPYAVAIHIVYFADDSSLRIKHFVSDSNDDISDPAGKFQEAVAKLVEWNKTQKINTIAMKEFQSLYEREAYPGLGTVKKLSIMHHIELIGKYLDGSNV